MAFIDMHTTLNELANSCPVGFRVEVQSDSDFLEGKVPKAKEILTVPDEDILGNGISHLGFTKEDIDADVAENGNVNWLPLETGLAQIEKVLSTLAKNGVILVGYAVDGYILRILNDAIERVLGKDGVEFRKDRLIDVERMSKVCVPLERCGNYFQRSVIATLLGKEWIESGPQFQTLEWKVSATKAILRKLMEERGLAGIQDVVSFLGKPHMVDRFNFGKYKGQRISDVYAKDRQYFSWLLSRKDLFEEDGDMLYTVSKMLDGGKDG